MRPRNRPVTDDFRASYRRLSKLARTWIAAPPITQRQGCGPRVLALLLRLLRRCAPGRLYRSTPTDPDSRLRRGWQKPRNGSRFGDLVGVAAARGPPAGDQQGVRVLRAGGLGTERTGPTAGTAETPMHLRETPVHSGNASVCGR